MHTYLSLPTDAGEVGFTFKGATYQNNSLVTVEDVGEGDNTLHCMTDNAFCCRSPYGQSAVGNWYFPNGTRVASTGMHWDFHRTRGQSAVRLQRRRGGENGVYSCVVPDAMNVTQTIYIGVYTRNTGERYMYMCLYTSTDIDKT